MKAGNPPSTPHCTEAGVDRTATHTDGEMQPLKATPGSQRLEAGLYPRQAVHAWRNGREAQGVGRAQQRVWPGLHSAWQGRPGEVGGGKEVFSGIREKLAPPAPQEQQCLGPAQAAVRRSNGGLEAAHRDWTPTPTPRGLEP